MTVETMFHVQGMKCDSCVANVTKALTEVVGYESAHVELKDGTVAVSGNIDPQAVCQALMQAGYPAVVKSK